MGSSNDAAVAAPGARPRSLATLLAGYALVLLATLALGSFWGELQLTPAAVWSALFEGAPVGDTRPTAFQLWRDLRLAPLLFAGAAGALLAGAGVVFQAALRNPLAEPYILGVSGGASLGVMVCQLAWPWVTAAARAPEIGLTFGAFVGALGAVVLLLSIARWARLNDPASLVLTGAVLNAIFGALILFCYSLAPQRQVVASLLWLMGNTGFEVTLGTHVLRDTGIVLALGAVVLYGSSRSFDLLALGDDEAADLGLSPRRFRAVALAGASLLTGMVVAMAGPIGFIGLVVPHVVRRLHGPAHRRLLPLSLLGGAVFLMIAHSLSRNAFPQVVPIGAVTALAGGPFFLFLLGASRREPHS